MHYSKTQIHNADIKCSLANLWLKLPHNSITMLYNRLFAENDRSHGEVKCSVCTVPLSDQAFDTNDNFALQFDNNQGFITISYQLRLYIQLLCNVWEA